MNRLRPGAFQLVLLLLSFSVLSHAGEASSPEEEVYHWVDENGVANFSQQSPGEHVAGVKVLDLPDTTPADFDPDEDRYGVQEQAERMAALREEREQRREARRQRAQEVQQPIVVQYQEPQQLGYPYRYLNRPNRPVRPPQKPERPIEEPPNISSLKPLRQFSN